MTAPTPRPPADAAPAPEGEVTLVFTDIQGSTELWEALPRAMSGALVLHDALMRETLADHGGYEVKTEGDAFMVAFVEPLPALRWCLVVQEGLTRMTWPPELQAIERGKDGLLVRMGVHTGRPECRRDPTTGRMDYFGPMVNRAARIGSAAHGGQVLVGAATWDRLALPGGAEVTDLGEHRLKGLSQAEHLRSVVPQELARRSFPPPRTLTVRFDLAPRRRTSLVRSGLDDALRQVSEALSARGEVRRWQGRAAEAEDDVRTALACARKLGEPRVEAYVLVNLGRLLFMTSRTSEARALFVEARDLAARVEDRWTQAAALSYVAACDTRLGAGEECVTSYRAALALAREIGNLRQEGVVLSNLGRHWLTLGRLEEAEVELRRAVVLLEQHGHKEVASAAVNNLGVVAVELDRDDARELLGRALASAQAVGERRMEAIIRSNLGAWLMTRGELAESEALCRAAVGGLVEMTDPLHAGVAAIGLATVLQRTGRPAEAVDLLKERLAALQEWPEPVEGDLMARLGAALADVGQEGDARLHLDRAAALIGDSEPHRSVLGICLGHLDRDPRRLDADASRSADLRLALACLRDVLGA